MMEAYFGMRRLPFGREIKSQDLIESFDVREAEARLTHIVNRRPAPHFQSEQFR